MRLTHLTEGEMAALGEQIAAALRVGDIIGLSGGLGAGKTTLARSILAALGLHEEAPSPTFAIVQPYDTPDVRLPVAHVDLYRIENPADCSELALDDYADYGVLLIEWPERLPPGIWPDMLRLTISGSGDTRSLTALAPAAWDGRWPPQ